MSDTQDARIAEFVRHGVVVFGPVGEGDRTISGGTYPMPGWGWCCTCKAAGFGYSNEDEADEYAERHAPCSCPMCQDTGQVGVNPSCPQHGYYDDTPTQFDGPEVER